jgi:predicted nucleic acid-binding protein
LILYVDTSALVPLLIDEPSSAICGELWDAADRLASSRLAYIEASAALAMAQRIGRISTKQAQAGRKILLELWTVVDIVEIDESLMLSASNLARMYGLRGYDATHCAAAVAIQETELVAASGDIRLLEAWRNEDLAVRDLNA